MAENDVFEKIALGWLTPGCQDVRILPLDSGLRQAPNILFVAWRRAPCSESEMEEWKAHFDPHLSVGILSNVPGVSTAAKNVFLCPH